MYLCGQRTVRMAVVACTKAKPSSLCAQAQLSETQTETVETLKPVKVEQNFEERRERNTEVREQALPSAYHRQTYLLK
ncbi:hypothetical protein TNCV_3489491 [Trichonephila clavipes]|nr:hypothetical protein TNCV_3489491 [Trichonephila clavipes]